MQFSEWILLPCRSERCLTVELSNSNPKMPLYILGLRNKFSGSLYVKYENPKYIKLEHILRVKQDVPNG